MRRQTPEPQCQSQCTQSNNPTFLSIYTQNLTTAPTFVPRNSACWNTGSIAHPTKQCVMFYLLKRLKQIWYIVCSWLSKTRTKTQIKTRQSLSKNPMHRRSHAVGVIYNLSDFYQLFWYLVVNHSCRVNGEGPLTRVRLQYFHLSWKAGRAETASYLSRARSSLEETCSQYSPGGKLVCGGELGHKLSPERFVIFARRKGLDQLCPN